MDAHLLSLCRPVLRPHQHIDISERPRPPKVPLHLYPLHPPTTPSPVSPSNPVALVIVLPRLPPLFGFPPGLQDVHCSAMPVNLLSPKFLTSTVCSIQALSSPASPCFPAAFPFFALELVMLDVRVAHTSSVDSFFLTQDLRPHNFLARIFFYKLLLL